MIFCLTKPRRLKRGFFYADNLILVNLTKNLICQVVRNAQCARLPSSRLKAQDITESHQIIFWLFNPQFFINFVRKIIMIIHVKPLAILVSALLSLNVTFANTLDSSQPTINQQQENTIGVQYALHNGKFYIKVNGLAFENVQDFLLNGEPITNKILELVTNQLATVLKENNAFTISFNLPKETNFSGMTFGIISGNQIYSSEMPAAVFAQDSIQTFDSVVSISDFNQIGNTRRSIVAGTVTLPNSANNAIYSTTNGTVKDLFIQSQPNDTRNTVINSGNAGKVGVGTNTPNAKLDLKGDMLVSPTGTSQFAKAPGLHLSFDNVDWGGEIASIRAIPTNSMNYYQLSPLSITSAEMLFEARDKSSSPIYQKITMVGSPILFNPDNNTPKNVSIGTKNNINKLDVAGGVAIGKNLAGFKQSPDNGLLVEGNVGIGTTTPGTNLHVHYHGKPQFRLSDNNGFWELWGGANFEVMQALTNRLFINGTGNVGIGTTNPTAKLEIDNVPSSWTTNNWRKAIKLNNGNAIQFGTTGTQFGIGASSDGDKLYFFTTSTSQQTAGANYAMTISNNGFVSFLRGSPSDRRWKTEIKPIDSALDKVEKMQGVSYRWNKETFQDADDKTHIGFIAQEVESVLPELVTTGSDGFKGVEYDKVTAVLVEALKELKAQNDALKAVICETNPTKPICQTK